MNKTIDTPDPLEFLLTHPSGVTPLDVDRIKLSAQYCAINGREFLAALASKGIYIHSIAYILTHSLTFVCLEIRNPAFDFLKPTHILFTYFTNLVECYTKLLNPSVNLRDKIKKYALNKMNVLESTVHRYEWNREIEQKKKEDGNGNELQDKTVDWSDFVVVDTIEFGEDELLAPLADSMHGLGLTTDEMPVENSKHLPPPLPPAPPVAPVLPSRGQSKLQQLQKSVDDDDSDIKVVHNYAPRVHTDVLTTANLTMIDPISGREVPINEVSEHMRIQLIDPKWREEQARFLEKQKDTGYAEGSSIADNLRQFAKKRSDIFGDSSSNASVEKRSKNEMEAGVSQQNVKPMPAYNFPPPVMPPPVAYPTAAFTPALPVLPPVLPPQPIIAGVTPIVLPSTVPMNMHPSLIPTTMAPIPPPTQTAVPTPVHVETAAEFAARFPSPIQLKVKVPFDPNHSNWKFNGQIIPIQIMVTDTVKSLKEQISSHLAEMPASKQQLKDVHHGFLKDPSTFAELKIGNNHTELELSVRSRGR